VLIAHHWDGKARASGWVILLPPTEPWRYVESVRPKAQHYMCGSRVTGVADMFMATCVLNANDKTIENYLRLAGILGYEEVDWKYEWKDGSRVVFSFAGVELRDTFYATRFLLY
jgi:hypothetical protein